MSFRVQKYPLAKPLSAILRHDQLPPGVRHLASVPGEHGNRDKLFVLVQNEAYLSVLMVYVLPLASGDEYCCDQFDFPLRTLSWFPRALEEFRKPPAEGGLHAGAMISADVDVNGEMLAVGCTTDGYYLINRSRTCHGNGDYYEPMEISFSHDLLYRQGFLNTWKTLGDRYEKGEL